MRHPREYGPMFPQINVGGFLFTASMELAPHTTYEWRQRLRQRMRDGKLLWALPGSRIYRNKWGRVTEQHIAECTADELPQYAARARNQWRI